ncbi:S-formylglutathione hydrolase [Vibrio marisflavi]|uniref:S-formylglutathione hydrolase n=1 Tax=Vibrio marisflavi CECT 7928 TaxID=634439 RepID=A0ABN8E0B8_9VIBR|nr:S-formylglutathione hydrolase [Vibrio marisflavi]CAH0536134.1 S-formylglutathione hydrolase YeiG [Vibrio marisflavi CECT 7928]
MSVKEISRNKVFGGWHIQYTHQSDTLNCDMRFAIFIPHNATQSNPVPAIYWLSGLTCTDENFMQKAGAFGKASELGIAIIASDTSPRGESVANAEDYDLGQGAGFYLNATRQPWANHYQMYDYVTEELPNIVETNFAVSNIKSIAGHSMGGHGAITIGLKNPDQYRSISAFSPICNPINVPWGQKAFSTYLGDNRDSWLEYDSVELLKKSRSVLPILVDQGDLDGFLTEQLKPETLIEAANLNQSPVQVRMQSGYDHSYYFISSFIDEHIQFHAKYLFAD